MGAPQTNGHAVNEENKAQVLIIGGGIVGLSLSHALKRQGISSIVFERDLVQARNQGWALSIHWCKAILENMLGPELAARLPEANVDPAIPQVNLKWDTVDARTGEIMYRLPTAGRFIRANRPKLRKLLSTGLDLRMNKSFKHYELIDDENGGGVRAYFADGSVYEGQYLIGCEGAASNVRKQLFEGQEVLDPLLFTSLAVVQTVSSQAIAPIRKVDNLLFQAIQPDTKVFYWHSIQDVHPETDQVSCLTYVSTSDRSAISAKRADEMSYPVEKLEDRYQLTAPTDADIIEDMKRHTEGFCEPFKSFVMNMSPEAPVTRLQLRDWVSQPWKTGGGRVSLAGDAAGPMTMYRGEGVNHGILDAFWLARTLTSIIKGDTPKEDAYQALKKYEETICKRRQFSTPLSRQATVDGHIVPAKDSPLVNVYKIPTDELDEAMKICEAELKA
ncbi:FAD/NAD(P)-binding domain-containing protein [Cystobasidium minutum MCA 4210]|uniref:FAD/NAD(P)-binding domain-containing protein n=1 Tax=Cystobasidium minutum MCA 4210 TaxID=1397322 RepID=UPI0034CE1BB3|eukprot:jgi/Rhomi1/195507/gm1.3721_g